MLLAGCSTDSTPASDTDTSAEAPATSAAPATPDESEAPAGAADGSGVAVDEVRDGKWQVGEAGELTFTLENGALTLGEVRAADGWEHRVTDEQADEIEVHFTGGVGEWKFEAELEKGNLQISKQLKIRDASSATVTVGSAATLKLTVNDGTLSVSEVAPAEGWGITKQDESPDEVELDFENGSAKAEFEAEFDRGVVSVEISQKMRA